MSTHRLYFNNPMFMLINRLFFTYKKQLFYAILGYLGIVVMINIFSISISQYDIKQIAFILQFFLIISLSMISGQIFKEIHSPTTAFNYLTLPASTFQKFFATTLFSFIGFGIIYIVLTFFGIVLSNLIAENNQVTTLPSINVLFGFKWYYIIGQPIFMLGSTYFKKAASIKTLAIVGISFITLLIISEKIAVTIIPTGMISSYIFIQDFDNTVDVYKYFILIALCWVASYYRLKEKEI